MKYKFNLILILFISILSYAQEKGPIETEIIIPAGEIVLNGSLLKPTTTNKLSLVIIIPGSGPTDRDGNNIQMKNNSLKFLAEELASKNIATYRYDKSVLSKENNINIDSLSFTNFINEANAVVEYFKKDNYYSNIIIAGHSQGSLVGIIASRTNVDGFISLEGAGRSIDEIIIEQITKQAPFLKEETERVLAELKKGNTVDEYNEMLKSLFNKPVQPFLISWIQINPQEEIKKLNIPVLIINGTKDIQVSVKDAELLHQSNPNSQLVLIENMNHLFKEINGDINENMNSYTNPDLPVIPKLVDVISTFVNEIK